VIRIADADRVRTITLDRPEKLNAFNEPLYAAAAAAFTDAAGDPAVAVVILTGEGRAFSAGF
jgi:enoyl-CoA hydratase/carnithine racemase